jgi:hypothetical protein
VRDEPLNLLVRDSRESLVSLETLEERALCHGCVLIGEAGGLH